MSSVLKSASRDVTKLTKRQKLGAITASLAESLHHFVFGKSWELMQIYLHIMYVDNVFYMMQNPKEMMKTKVDVCWIFAMKFNEQGQWQITHN